MAKIIEFKKIDITNHDKVTFIRVNPENIKQTLLDIFNVLSDLSWIRAFDDDYIRNSFEERAKRTIETIYKKLTSSDNDLLSSSAGEYIVSELSREVIISKLNYLDIPLAELYNKKKSNNPGFDFHTQNDCHIIIFGEAKYLKNKNAYNTGIKQVVQFIEQKKDINDIPELRDFFEPTALKNANEGIKGFAVGFSAKNDSNDELISRIIKNENYKELLKYSELILVAVNL